MINFNFFQTSTIAIYFTYWVINDRKLGVIQPSNRYILYSLSLHILIVHDVFFQFINLRRNLQILLIFVIQSLLTILQYLGESLPLQLFLFYLHLNVYYIPL